MLGNSRQQELEAAGFKAEGFSGFCHVSVPEQPTEEVSAETLSDTLIWFLPLQMKQKLIIGVNQFP